MTRRTEDWVGESSDLLDKLRPQRLRYDVAIIVVSVCSVLAAYFLKPTPFRYAMVTAGEVVFVLDRTTGQVAGCRYVDGLTECSEDDSATSALIRRLNAEP